MNDVFPMVPAPAKAVWCFGAIVILLVGLLGFFGYLAYACRHVTFEISDGGLSIQGDLYARQVPAKSIVVELARRVDLATTPELVPKVRANGTALPGYRAGWFTLQNGDKALLYLTDAERVVYVPTRDGFSLMLSVPDPEAFLKALESKCPRIDNQARP